MLKKPFIVAITGASGVIYAVRLLEVLKKVPEIETHVIISQAGKETLRLETDYSTSDIKALADVYHDNRNIAASLASGSFRTLGMVIVPCTIKTLSAVANCYGDNLISRAADVCLKERLPLTLCVRETPLHLGQLRLMTQVAEMGVQIMPLMPAFYHHPQSLDDIVMQGVVRICDQFNIPLPENIFTRWPLSQN